MSTESQTAPEIDDQRVDDAASIEKTDDELAAEQRQAEVDALENVFLDVRVQSAHSELVTPDRWADEGFIPEHLDSQQFVDLVFGYLADAAEQEESAENDVCDSADSTQGTAEQTEPEADMAEGACVSCDDIAFLEGAETMYLYSRDHMTDTYANWAFLAREDDKVITLVQCAREESRVYPRPMIFSSLKNAPFRMTEDEILDAWKTVQESQLYPDIASCRASNDDIYFYSTDYLSSAQANALAEWYSVEQGMNV